MSLVTFRPLPIKDGEQHKIAMTKLDLNTYARKHFASPRPAGSTIAMNESLGLSHQAGPLLLGYLFNWALHGVLTVQVYVYWTAFPTDILRAQMLVYSLYILETAQTVLLTHDAFQTFVFGFMDPLSVDHVHNLWLSAYIFDGLAALLVQLYFSHRIHVLLSRTKLIPGIIILLSTFQFFGAIGVGNIFKSLQFFSRGPEISRSQKYTNITGFLWVMGAAIADIIIAITMVYALSRYDTSFRETRNFVKRLNRLTMETGSLTAVTAVVQPFLFFIYPERNYWVTPALCIAKLYSNSLLVIFNSRVRIHGARDFGDTYTRGGGWRTRISVTPNPNLDEVIPLSTFRSRPTERQIPSALPSNLEDSDGFGLPINASGTKTINCITNEV